MIDKDAAHQLGRDAEEMRAVLPVYVSLINEPEISLIDERRGLQRMAGTFLY